MIPWRRKPKPDVRKPVVLVVDPEPTRPFDVTLFLPPVSQAPVSFLARHYGRPENEIRRFRSEP